ncbi:hypothetical protein LTR47_011712 [Exophiala xenobiotica]|nr:hypothetical protein LTR92_011056 [Exophiala xenobiotica]KAK5215462.1 hypothetical protein LTR72_011490 [Exophiala xenobiotica]KAK5218476.1 hypothetical protein LTR47_011712 [Exophiala xenobiotica]KAK5283527.1 hypothetical protein LTR14_011864 [Exophiala xenobiotica]KAK5313488.1 hypothetical protein LTR93_010890 [Exophiala xenobiotica]
MSGVDKDVKLSETFRIVGSRLPVLLGTLQTCKSHLQPIRDSLPADVCLALEKILEAFDERAGKPRQIFEKVLPGEHDAWEKRYVKVVKRFGKGSKVEELMGVDHGGRPTGGEPSCGQVGQTRANGGAGEDCQRDEVGVTFLA